MVYKRVTGWTSGRSLPVLNFGYYAELSKYVASSWKYAWTTNLPRFTNACQEVPHFNERLTGCFEKFVYYSIRHIKFIHMEEACWYRETFSKRFIATSLTTKSHKWRSQQKPSHVPRKKTLYSWLQRKTLQRDPCSELNCKIPQQLVIMIVAIHSVGQCHEITGEYIIPFSNVALFSSWNWMRLI